MSKLNREPNFDDPDAVYKRLIDFQSHDDETVVRRRNAKLVLLLANHIGDEDVIFEAIEVAEKSEETEGE